jgi:hypothetical protein
MLKDQEIAAFLSGCFAVIVVSSAQSSVDKTPVEKAIKRVGKQLDKDTPLLIMAMEGEHPDAMSNVKLIKTLKLRKEKRPAHVQIVSKVEALNMDADGDDGKFILSPSTPRPGLNRSMSVAAAAAVNQKRIKYLHVGFTDGIRWIVRAMLAKFSNVRKDGGVLWRSPAQFLSSPALVIKDEEEGEEENGEAESHDGENTSGMDSREVVQGNLETCYLLAAVSVCARHEGVLERLFIVEDLYADVAINNGIFGMMFFVNGMWRAVFVDDQFPTTEDGQFVFSRCLDKNELWMPVLEKCYAKFYGGYQHIVGGLVNEAFQDLTGGPTAVVNLRDPDVSLNDLWQKLLLYHTEGYLLGCGNPLPPGSSQKLVINRGIISGHAYSLLDIREVEGHRLLHLRNPWGDTEWEGDWGDNSDLWTNKIKKLLHHVPSNDGDFWIGMGDFISYFQSVYVCRLFKDVVDKAQYVDKESQDEACAQLVAEGKRPWYKASKKSSWDVKNRTAQGAPTSINKNRGADFSKNPQFKLLVAGTRPAVVFITCTQYPLVEDTDGKSPKQFIAFDVFDNKGLPITGTMKKGDFVVAPMVHTNQREISQEIILQHDTEYTIYPSTLELGGEAKFTLACYCREDIFLTTFA